MYLKALEIQGFKSFPDKTRLTFEKDITAIVGPNGSGKSNISDAVLWVMGEQRTKALRGGKMEDVIFGGTEKRPKMGFAQVSLVVDNSERVFNTDSSEVMLTRRYYRSGESEYYINKESVRLKDITELLMDTGLGRYGYSIIGQGRIADVVSAKSTDRRELFEEAAGIARFRYRKDESERKLSHTQDNLLRINDKIDELKIQVEPLKKQSEIAKKYLILRDELRLLEVSVWVETLDRLKENAVIIENDWKKAQTELLKAQEELAELYSASENFSEKMREKDLEAEKAREQLSLAETAGAQCESELAVLHNSIKHNGEREAQLKTELFEQGARIEGLKAQIEKRNERVHEIGLAISQLDAELLKLSESMSRNAEKEEGLKNELAALFAQKSEKQAELSRCSTVLSMLSDARTQQKTAAFRQGEMMQEALSEKNRLHEQLSEEKSLLSKAEDKEKEISNIIEGYSLRLESRKSRVKKLEDEKTSLTIELNGVKSRGLMLSEMEKEFEGFSKSVKIVMQEAARGSLKGVFGPVANLVKTDERYTLAIETALGASMQSIVVETQEQGKAAIELLKRRDGGRATFLPLSSIKPGELRRRPDNEAGYLGTALELASFDRRFADVFSNLLARTVVAETLGDAISMSKHFDNQLRIVTLDGQLINAGGSMTGGSAAKNAGILSRANELKALRIRLKELEGKEKALAEEVSAASRELSGASYELQTAQEEKLQIEENRRACQNALSHSEFLLIEAEKNIEKLSAEIEDFEKQQAEGVKKADEAKKDALKLEKELAELEERQRQLSFSGEEKDRQRKELSERLSAFSEERSSLLSERDTTAQAALQLQELLTDLSGDGDFRMKALEELKKENEAITCSIQLSEEKLDKAKKLQESIRHELSSINEMKLELEGKRSSSDKKAQEKNRELLDMERLSASIEQKKLASEMEEKQIIDKLWDSYELSRTAAMAMGHPIESMGAATKKIGSIKREISALGTPNIGAIEEYERVSERYDFLTEQRDDVEKAKHELEKIISDITREMKEIFLREFHAIDESFRKTFLELFGGGRASLILEDEDDILNCGIEIKVQPPGKALSTISLLSGGEKAFVAIALYFAIIKVRPAPFCVMDEIEAALDEANVDRYARYMRSMSDKTQFIVITHRRGTMEEADMLYGVTMQEKGVTQVIALDLQEAEAELALAN